MGNTGRRYLSECRLEAVRSNLGALLPLTLAADVGTVTISCWRGRGACVSKFSCRDWNGAQKASAGAALRSCVAAIGISAVGLLASQGARADNICYQYDALGRLVGSLTTPGACPATLPAPGSQPSDSTLQKISYDRAGNRTLYQVAGADAYARSPKVIVLPLNGFTIIPLEN